MAKRLQFPEYIFTRHFNFEVIQQANIESAMLRGNDGFSLVLTAIDKNSPQTYPSSLIYNFRISFHVGFVLEKKDEVYAKHKELIDNSYSPGKINVFEALGTTWTSFYFTVGNGIDIEVTSHN